MITLYAGRLVIERRRLSENWQATIRLAGAPERHIDLCTPDVREAFIRAQHHYMALRNGQTFDEVQEEHRGKVKCWSCMQWLPRSNECSFGFPEARQTGGRYAARCELFSDGTEGVGAVGPRP